MNKINYENIEQTFEELLETFRIKNIKYGNSFETTVDKYGLIAALTRMSDKFNRLETLILNHDDGTKDETLQDTLLDLANYCTMTAAYIKERRNNED